MKLLGMLVAVLLLAQPGTAKAKEAQTLDELVARFDSTRCQECHPEIYAARQQSLHGTVRKRIRHRGHLLVAAPLFDALLITGTVEARH